MDASCLIAGHRPELEEESAIGVPGVTAPAGSHAASRYRDGIDIFAGRFLQLMMFAGRLLYLIMSYRLDLAANPF
jgi:hypothetical protein